MKVLFMMLALVISVTGYEDIPEQGMEVTVNEAYEDILSGDMLMKVEGSLICSNPLTVTITRSSEGLIDEFCCAGQCIGGNEETSQTLHFAPGGMASWYVHYTPTPGSYETITYLFDDGSENRTLTVHFDYTTLGMETVESRKSKVESKKILRDGILYIIKDNKKYTIL
ncbi:MAG: hypothetical protein IKM83_04565 [Paludibacteraceae bacterium]|nr:hypothetical protein [Paludibacteraceae bacterium]